MTTLAPAADISSAIDLPIPREDPVMSGDLAGKIEKWIAHRFASVMWSSLSSGAVGELQLCEQRAVAGVAFQIAEERIPGNAVEAAVALLEGALQPLEGFVFLAAPGVDIGDLVGHVAGILGDQLLERGLRLFLVTAGVFDHGDAHAAISFGALLLELGLRFGQAALQQVQLTQGEMERVSGGADGERALDGGARGGVVVGHGLEQADVGTRRSRSRDPSRWPFSWR